MKIVFHICNLVRSLKISSR